MSTDYFRNSSSICERICYESKTFEEIMKVPSIAVQGRELVGLMMEGHPKITYKDGIVGVGQDIDPSKSYDYICRNLSRNDPTPAFCKLNGKCDSL